ETDKAGWFLSAEIISDDKNLHLSMWLDGQLIATNSPQGFYVGGSRLTMGIPNTFIYGQIIPGTNRELYGMTLYTTTGYPYNQSIKVSVETMKEQLYIESYQVFMIEIYDPELFKKSLLELFTPSYSIRKIIQPQNLITGK
ncbi:MAG: hypothetical protein ACPLVI_06115, partial [Thermoplasmata archaeon]